jgi:hypothetical protein
LVNSIASGDHIHSVIRDFDNDLGGDLLARNHPKPSPTRCPVSPTEHPQGLQLRPRPRPGRRTTPGGHRRAATRRPVLGRGIAFRAVRRAGLGAGVRRGIGGGHARRLPGTGRAARGARLPPAVVHRAPPGTGRRVELAAHAGGRGGDADAADAPGCGWGDDPQPRTAGCRRSRPPRCRCCTRDGSTSGWAGPAGRSRRRTCGSGGPFSRTTASTTTSGRPSTTSVCWVLTVWRCSSWLPRPAPRPSQRGRVTVWRWPGTSRPRTWTGPSRPTGSISVPGWAVAAPMSWKAPG